MDILTRLPYGVSHFRSKSILNRVFDVKSISDPWPMPVTRAGDGAGEEEEVGT